MEQIGDYTLRKGKSVMWKVYSKEGKHLVTDFYWACKRWAENGGRKPKESIHGGFEILSYGI